MIERPIHYLIASGMPKLQGSAEDPALEPASKKLSDMIAKSLGAGLGCDSEDDEHSKHWPWPVQIADSNLERE